ncbi:MAG: HlyC/CorC family transporter [Acidimicrobiia bacterium]|nr:HlyC/CorC family transporter [Acidimicrobiia bacterium]
MIFALLAGVVLLLANGFFVAVEFALVGARQTQLEPAAEGGDRRARLALGQMRDLNRQLAGAQLGITMASLLLGYVAEPAVVHGLEDLFGEFDVPTALSRGIALALGLAIVVFLHMVIGEMVPKNLAIAEPERAVLRLARLNQLYLTVFGPLVSVLNWVATGGLRLLGVQPRDAIDEAHTAEELASMLAEAHGEGLIEDFAHELLVGVLDFGDTTARQIMVEVDDIVGVSWGGSAADAEAVASESHHSRLPVYGRSIDEPKGFVHVKDLLALSDEETSRPIPARLVRRLPVVRPELPCDDLLAAMRTAGVHLALVADGGRTLGLVTLEDLLEELVGDILDESDADADGEAQGRMAADPPRR